MCIATRCTTVDQFVAMFHRFVDEDSFFVSTMNTRPPGLETSFSVQLADGTPVLRGLCTVLQVWTTATSPFKTPGVRLGIKRLTANSMPVFERLLVTRSKPAASPPAPPPALAAGTVRPAGATAVIAAPTFGDTARTTIAPRPQTLPASPPTLPGLPAPPTRPTPSPIPTRPTPPPMSSAAAAVAAATATVTESGETRTPGSELVLPANPLMNLTDASLEGYVDCTLYEETGSFFPVDDTGAPIDELVPPPTAASVPVLAPRPVARLSTPVEIVSELGMDESPPNEERPPESTVEPRVLRATPPPMPVVSVPELEPQPESELPLPAPALPVPAPALAFRDSTPAGELTGAQPRSSGKRGLWLVGAVVAAAAGAALWVTMSSHDDADASTASTPPTRSAANAGPTGGEPPVVKPAVEPPAPPPPEPTEPDDAEPEQPAEPVDPPDAQSPVAGDGPCSVVVTSTPAGSTVLLDGRVIAPSPIMIATTCERHRIDIKHPRYKLATKFVTLKEGSPGSIDTTLQRPTHTVKITSQPSNATIYIDGRRAGTTPTVLSVMGFSNLTLEIKKTGYATMSRKLYSKVSQDSLSVKLSKW